MRSERRTCIDRWAIDDKSAPALQCDLIVRPRVLSHVNWQRKEGNGIC